MRISTTQLFRTGIETMNAQQSDLMHLFQQIGTGRRLVSPADDPLASSQTINIAQTESMNLRYATNRNVANQNLALAESTLDSVTRAMQDVRTTIVQAGNIYTDTDRASLANVLRVARENLLSQANATDGNGQYLFSGHRGDTQPYSLDEATGVVTYHGDTGSRLIQVDQTRQMDSAHVGSDIFNRASPGSQIYLTSANAANNGTGQISTPQVTDPTHANAGMNFRVDFAGDPLEYTVTVIDPATNAETTGAPVAYTGGGTLDLGGVNIKLTGTPVAGDSFRAEQVQNTDVDLFKSLDDVIKALETPADGDPVAQARLNNVLASVSQRLAVNYDNILTVRAAGGTRMAELDSLDANGNLRNLNYKEQLSSLENVDYYSASSQLTLRQAALEAATLAFRKIQNTSLFATQN